jgi:hypothetical protein
MAEVKRLIKEKELMKEDGRDSDQSMSDSGDSDEDEANVQT